jgi:branched-chain amino acid transport system substrate-binding protein
MALAAAAPPDAAAEIPIGFAHPLSGAFAQSGQRNRIAVEMAVADLNERGGVLGEPIKLITADDACGLQSSVEAARELVKADVRFVVGHFCSHSSLLAAGIYETEDVLMVTPSSTHPRLTEEGRQNVFRLYGRDDRQGRLAGDFLADRWRGAQIAILHDGSTYGEGLALEAREQLRARGETEAIYDLYTPDADDYAGLLGRLEQAGIDVLYIGGYGPDAGRILRTAREQGVDLQLIGGDGLDMDEFWAVAGDLGEGTIFSGRPEVRARPQAARLLARFQARGLGPRDFSLAAYAAVQVWAQAVERAATLELAAVSEILRRGRFDTVLGRVAFDHKGDLEDAAWQWKVWTEGDYVPLDRLTAIRDHPGASARVERTRRLLDLPARGTEKASPRVIRRAGARKRREHPRWARACPPPADTRAPWVRTWRRSRPPNRATRSPGARSRRPASPSGPAAAARWSSSRTSAGSAG